MIDFGREICGHLPSAEQREWLVTNGIGGFAAGTVAGLLTRCYHGLLVAALDPPLGHTLLLAKLDGLARYQGQYHPLATNRWRSGAIAPQGYREIERFRLEGAIPTWTYAFADAQLEQQIWMAPSRNTTYIRYTLARASHPLDLSLKALVNYRDRHQQTQGDGWVMTVDLVERGVQVRAFDGAVPFFILASLEGAAGTLGDVWWELTHQWYRDFDLAVERYRGLGDRDDHLHAASLEATLQPGDSLTVVASTEPQPHLDGRAALAARQSYEDKLRERWRASAPAAADAPAWIEQLAIAADQFIVERTLPDGTAGKTVIAGYPWFGDWGRDTAIALPGLTLATGRPEIARTILQTFAGYLDQGMLPNLFPDGQHAPEYNTVDAILWYFEALRAYVETSQDRSFLRELFPQLREVIDWHCRGTRYHIQRDPSDGLLYAGEAGVQLTWMDAKVGDWVVTPRIGKPIEVNALWYRALVTMGQFAQQVGEPSDEYERLAQAAAIGFKRFWQRDRGYCYDVLDGPEGNDSRLRPNQIFAVSLPASSPSDSVLPLLLPEEQKSVVDTVARSLLTSHGLRSLAPEDPDYVGLYGGDRRSRDGAYHQGTVWGWLLGHFAQAHWHVYGDAARARSFLAPLQHHLQGACLGTLSEIFDGNSPHQPRGAFAQAWTVAEVLRAWQTIR